MPLPLRSADGGRPHVVIVGGGFAAAEALIALRTYAGDRARITLVADRDELVLRPMASATPFGIASPERVALADLCADHDAELRHGQVTLVDPPRRVIETDRRETILFDAALLAPGARTRSSIEGALRFDGRKGVIEMRALAAGADDGRTPSVAFAVPGGVTWALPAYELALMTAARAPEGAHVLIVTPEAAPLEAFGAPASARVRELLAERGVCLHTSRVPERVVPAGLVTDRGMLAVQRVVALPRIEGPRLPGLLCDRDGFLVVDAHGLVDGTANVYAAGDATSYPVKQGGLAAQQADAAALAIAARLGAPVEARPFSPVLRAVLLTGRAPLYLRGPGEAGPAVSDTPLWRPVGKVVARHLGPWLAARRRAGAGSAGPLATSGVAVHPSP